MRIVILRSAIEDLIQGQAFYERQGEGLGDYFEESLSADVHVRRVFWRLGLTSKEASVDQLIFRARGLHPVFPGLMDFPAWEIGRNWCRPRKC